MEHAKNLYLKSNKDLTLAMAVKIFSYPNEINSVRVMLAVFYPPDK